MNHLDRDRGVDMPLADEVLDCTGLICPMPIAKLSERISLLPAGSVLEVVADDHDFPSDVEAYCRTTGAMCLCIESRGRETHAFLMRPAE